MCASTVVHSDWGGVSKPPQCFLSSPSKPAGSSATAFCYTLNPSFLGFFFVSLLKCILQQHPTWLSDIPPLTTLKLSMATLLSFTVPSLWLSIGGKLLSLIIVHTLKKVRSYYLCQSNRNKWKEGSLACQRACETSNPPSASATELASLTTN